MADEDRPQSELLAELGEMRVRLAAAEAAVARAQRHGGAIGQFEARHRALAESTDAGLEPDARTHSATEQALYESEGRFRSLVRDLQVGVIVVERDEGERAADSTEGWCITLANQAVLDIFDIPEEQLLGLNPFTAEWPAVHEDGSAFPTREHPLQRAIQTGQPERGVVMGFTRAEAEQIWVLVDAVPHFGRDGTVQRAIGTFIDITTRRAIETALRDSEARFRAVVETVPSSIWIYDGDDIVFVNEALVALTGYSRDELLQPRCR